MAVTESTVEAAPTAVRAKAIAAASKGIAAAKVVAATASTEAAGATYVVKARGLCASPTLQTIDGHVLIALLLIEIGELAAECVEAFQDFLETPAPNVVVVGTVCHRSRGNVRDRKESDTKMLGARMNHSQPPATHARTGIEIRENRGV
ncbi:hypothetical protein OsI_15116 [Oryza sativa Indica Group]|uniref:Uncharacterized protein n=1 Tax=Oryza sativa subsp. indica TaxID=39946 RepID=A2XR49_ORYSI|nr:hypothetical protein OsI_15116 [Oryza sativa Indica Group]